MKIHLVFMIRVPNDIIRADMAAPSMVVEAVVMSMSFIVHGSFLYIDMPG